MKISLAIGVASLCTWPVLGANAGDKPSAFETVAPFSAAVLASARDQADVAVARSLINSNHLKGAFAENLTNTFILDGKDSVGKWRTVSPRLGPQGLDHIAVRLDRLGRLRGLLVGETKYASGRLISTDSGIQMGPVYTSKRLAGLAGRLRSIASQIDAGIGREIRPGTLNSRYEVNIPLDEDTAVTFWRDRSSSNLWNYDGPSDLLEKSRRQLLLLSAYFTSASEGKIAFAKRIFAWRVDGSDLRLSVFDAKSLQEGMSLSGLPKQELPPIRINSVRWARDAFKDAYSTDLIKKLPNLSREELSSLAEEVYIVHGSVEGTDRWLSRESFARFALTRSGKSALMGIAAAVPFDIAFQLWEDGAISWERVLGVSAASALSAAAGTYVGDYTTSVLMQSQFGSALTAKAAELAGLRSGARMTNLAGEFAEGGTAWALFAYVGYGLGYYDLTTANRTALAGVVGSASGVAASAATMGLLAVYGTAGTGVAISSLSGAAATNASLALLGGGTVASGGLGVAGGSLIAGTGVGAVVIGVTAATMYGFHLYDKAQENKRIELTLLNLQRHYER